MKKTTEAKVAKTLFTFDQDALEHLENYLNSLEEHFKENEDAHEILEDIEASLAEKLSKSNAETIDLKAVKECIEKIGTLEELVSGSDHAQNADRAKKTEQRKFARDPEARWIGGVASGFARYFNIEVIWVRIIFVLLSFFTRVAPIVYILFWIFMTEESSRLSRKELDSLKNQRWYLGLGLLIALATSTAIGLVFALVFGDMMSSFGAIIPTMFATRLPETLFLIYLAVKLLRNREPSKFSAVAYLVFMLLTSLLLIILLASMSMHF